MSGEYRQYLFPHDHPRVAEVRGMDPYTYGEFSRKPGTFTGGLVEGWTPLYKNEFRGVTEDGTLRERLYPFEPARPGEEAPVAEMVAAANELLAALDDDGRKRISFDVDAVEWQTWANPEFMQFDTGLRLDLQPAEVRTGPSGALEKPYRSTGASWWLDNPLGGAAPDVQMTPYEAFQQELAEAGPESLAFFTRLTLQLSAEEAAELDRRLLAVLDPYVETDHERLDRPAHGGMVVFHRLAD